MKKFKKDEIIWGKMTGFPWWPCQIKRIFYRHKGRKSPEAYEDHPLLSIEFYGDHSTGLIIKKNADKFLEKFEDYSQTRRPKLKRAINEAKKSFINSNKNLSPDTLYNVLGKKRYRSRKGKPKNKSQPKKTRQSSTKLENKKHIRLLEGSQRNILETIDKNFNESSDDSFCKFSSSAHGGSNKSKRDEESSSNNSISSSSEMQKENMESVTRKIELLMEDLIKCKIDVRRKHSFQKALSDMEELKEIIKSEAEISNFYRVSLILFFNLS